MDADNLAVIQAGLLHTYIPNRVIDSNGIADGSELAFYLTGTLTPAPIYTTEALSVEMTNPVVVAAGAAVPDIWLDPAISYRRIVTTPDGGTQDTDPWTSIASAGVSFIQTGDDTVTRTIQDKLRDELNAADFGVSAANSAAVNAPLIAAAVTEAITSGRDLKFPTGVIECDTQILLPDEPFTLRIVGSGRPHATSDGVNGDPTGLSGTQLAYTGNTGSMFKLVLTGADRAYITFENLTIEGNSSGASGHGIHLQTVEDDCGISVVYRDVTVRNCKQHGVFHDGGAFECYIYNLRCPQNGSAGFKAAADGAGIPGETYIFGGYFNGNDIGIDLGGGGHFALFGVSCTANITNQIKANSVYFEAVSTQMEGTSATALSCEYMLLQGCRAPVIIGTVVNLRNGSTGAGIKMETVFSGLVNSYRSNSDTEAGGGFYDIEVDDACRTCEVNQYSSAGADLVYLGTEGGHVFRRAGQWLSGQAHAQLVYSITSTAQSQAPDSRAADSFIYNVANAVASFTIASPTANTSYKDGQRITITIYNNSGGAPTITWGAGYTVNNVAPVPTGTRRTIQFEYNANTSKWNQVSATLGAVASHIADPTGGATVDTESRAAIVSIINALEAHGLAAP